MGHQEHGEHLLIRRCYRAKHRTRAGRDWAFNAQVQLPVSKPRERAGSRGGGRVPGHAAWQQRAMIRQSEDYRCVHGLLARIRLAIAATWPQFDSFAESGLDQHLELLWQNRKNTVDLAW